MSFRSVVRIFIAVSTFVIPLSFISWKTASGPLNIPQAALAPNPSKMAGDILDLINKYRQSKGLTTLQMNAVVTAEAENHSANMAGKKTAFGHDGFENRVRQITQSVGPVRASAENVADGQLSAKEVVEGWLKSPGHRRNIEGNFTLTGIGVAADGGGTLYYTQIFIQKF